MFNRLLDLLVLVRAGLDSDAVINSDLFVERAARIRMLRRAEGLLRTDKALKSVDRVPCSLARSHDQPMDSIFKRHETCFCASDIVNAHKASSSCYEVLRGYWLPSTTFNQVQHDAFYISANCEASIQHGGAMSIHLWDHLCPL